MTKNAILSSMTLIAVLLATWTTLLWFRPPYSINTMAIQLPDAFMEDVVAIIMDKQGKPKMKLVTPKIIHFTEDNTSRLTTPQLTLYRESPIPWKITARFAKATQGTERIDFWDDVQISHPGDQTNPATVIKTEMLTVHPNEETAETNENIIMQQPSITINAIGMHANMSTGDIKLISQVRGEYASNA